MADFFDEVESDQEKDRKNRKKNPPQPTGTQSSSSGGAPAWRNDSLARSFELDAQNYANDGDYEEAVKMLKLGIGELNDESYTKKFNEKIKHWKLIDALKKKTAEEWKHHTTNSDRTVFRKKISNINHGEFYDELDDEAKTYIDEKVEKKLRNLRGDEREDAKKQEIQKFLRGRFVDSASSHLSDLDKEKGIRRSFSKIDDIQRAIAEATRLGDLGKKKNDVNFIDRALDLIKQAENDCLDDKDFYYEQYKQVKDLKEKYERDKDAIHRLRELVGSSPSHPFISRKLKIYRDDTEKRRDSYDNFGASLSALHKAQERYEEDPAKKKFDADSTQENEDALMATSARAALDEARDTVKDVYEKEKKTVSKLVSEKDDAHIKKAMDDHLTIEDGLITSDSKSIKKVLKSVTTGAENARRRAELSKNYEARSDTQRTDAQDLYRDRALSSHEHWGTGGTAVVDAAEWIGFARNPIETIGNLAATYLAWRIVVYGIVGPILDTFSFFIPFINILKVPIYLIALIILHPFMKTILHPIKRDLHFLAGDPYWYKEGTSVDKVRSKAYDAGGAVSDKTAEYNDAGDQWIGRRKEQI
ncbi:MAG: hypothetical protein KAJ24_02410, partial [Candidatus Aenigmarchaeota archaeon]|nr:hypothetical protein [Candidatus Aenigmarchaeota archaeon]